MCGQALKAAEGCEARTLTAARLGAPAMPAHINPIVSQVDAFVAQPLALCIAGRGALGQAQAAAGGDYPVPGQA